MNDEKLTIHDKAMTKKTLNSLRILTHKNSSHEVNYSGWMVHKYYISLRDKKAAELFQFVLRLSSRFNAFSSAASSIKRVCSSLCSMF